MGSADGLLNDLGGVEYAKKVFRGFCFIHSFTKGERVMNNRQLMMGFVIAGIFAHPVGAQNNVVPQESAHKSIITDAQTFFYILSALPPKVKTIVATLETVQTTVQAQIDLFKNSTDTSVKIEAIATLVDQLGIVTELFIGSFTSQGSTTDYGQHNFPGILTDLAHIVTINDSKVGAQITSFIPYIQQVVSNIDIIGQALHQVATEFAAATKTKFSIDSLAQSEIIMNALSNLPAQIDLITTTFSGVISHITADCTVLGGQGSIATKIGALADIVNQVAIVAELCVGSKLLPSGSMQDTVDLGNHSFTGVFNEINKVILVLDPTSGTQIASVLTIVSEYVSYIDIVAKALVALSGNFANIGKEQAVVVH